MMMMPIVMNIIHDCIGSLAWHAKGAKNPGTYIVSNHL